MVLGEIRPLVGTRDQPFSASVTTLNFRVNVPLPITDTIARIILFGQVAFVITKGSTTYVAIGCPAIPPNVVQYLKYFSWYLARLNVRF